MVRAYESRSAPSRETAGLRGDATLLRIGDDCGASACKWLLEEERVGTHTRHLGTSRSTQFHRGNAAY